MNRKQLAFTILTVGLAGGLPVILLNGVERLIVLASYGLSTLIILGIIGAITLYAWLGEN